MEYTTETGRITVTEEARENDSHYKFCVTEYSNGKMVNSVIVQARDAIGAIMIYQK